MIHWLDRRRTRRRRNNKRDRNKKEKQKKRRTEIKERKEISQKEKNIKKEGRAPPQAGASQPRTGNTTHFTPTCRRSSILLEQSGNVDKGFGDFGPGHPCVSVCVVGEKWKRR